MFTKAILRLTAWYVAILMALSLMFTFWLYAEGTGEVRAGLNAQLLRPYASALPHDEVVSYLDRQYDASRMRIIGSLVLMNLGVLAAGSLASYLLARRTLQPIEDALDAQNRFTADASHELRTPLTTMKTEIEVGLRNKNMTAKEGQLLLESNVEEIDRLTKLADGLLILARTGDKPALEPVHLKKLAETVCERFGVPARARHITIRHNINNVTAMANATHVDTVLGILVDNAIKYGSEKSEVTVAVSSQDNQACLAVRNTGPGIAAGDLPHIFERFYRADTARTSGKAAGHGLGLSIAHKLVTNMNGSISVKSSVVGGTTFTVCFALA